MKSEIIKQSTELLNSSNSWGVVPIVILFSILVLGVAWFFIKTILKFTDKMSVVIDKNTQGYEMLKNSLEKANETNAKLIDNINDNLRKSIDFHTQTHYKLELLKEQIRNLKICNETNKKADV